MKRPLAFFGFTLFAVLLCLEFVGSTAVSVCLSAVSFVSFLLSLFIKKSRQSLFLPVILSAVVTGCLFASLAKADYSRTVSLTGENVKIEGVVAESPYFSRENERYYCVINTKTVNGEKVRTKLRISFSRADDGIDPQSLDIGNGISFSGTVYKAGYAGLQINRYFKSQGIYLGAYSLKNTVITESRYRTFSYYVDLLRDKITENLLHDFDSDVSAFLVAILTGSKEYMNEDIYEDFVRAGVVHIMAVSGLHLSVWVMFLSLFVRFDGRKGKFMAVIMIGFTVFMMNFAYFTGSVKRAAAMTVLHFIGKLCGKKSDSLNSLGFAVMFALLPAPFAVFDISFVLSFLSTLGIILMGIPAGDKLAVKLSKGKDELKSIIRPFTVSLGMSVSVAVFTFPVMLCYFDGFSLASPITNIMFLFVVSPVLVLTGLYSFLRFVPFLSGAVAVTVKYLSLYILKVAEYIGSFSLSYLYFDTTEIKIALTVAFTLLVIALIFYKYDRVLHKVFAIMSVEIFILSVAVNFYFSFDKCTVTVFESGSAMVSVGGHGVLVGFEGDTYDEKEITDYAKRRNIKTDCAVFVSDILTSAQKNLCHSLSAENLITSDGTSVTLFDRVTIKKSCSSVTLRAKDVKTYIFYQEPLQEGEIYDTIADSDILHSDKCEKNFAFSLGANRPFAFIVRGENLSVRGETDWLSLMKKALKVT